MIRAGIPTIITPVFLDQFDQAYLVQQLGIGVGFSKQFQKITANELAGAMSKVTAPDNPYQSAVRSIAAKLREESGAKAKAAVTEIKKHWEENTAIERWQEVMRSQLKAAPVVSVAMLASIGVIIAAMVCGSLAIGSVDTKALMEVPSQHQPQRAKDHLVGDS